MSRLCTTPISALRAVRAWFFEHPESYYPHALAKDGLVGVSPTSSRAVQFSVAGALERATGCPPTWPGTNLPVHVAMSWISKALGPALWVGWNLNNWEKASGRCAADVVGLLDQAIALALAADAARYARQVYFSCNESKDTHRAWPTFEMLWGCLHVDDQGFW